MNAAAMETLLTFVSRLLSIHGKLDTQGNERPSLLLAEGLLLKQRLRQRSREQPIQVAIIGPTQVGKSTLVNLLLEGNYAGVSALAGFTRHAQGFCPAPLTEAIIRTAAALLPHLERIAPGGLSQDRLDAYSLIEVSTQASATQPSSILWDSPDFDSVSSREYRLTVPSLCALADLLILVVSREKYADRSVWELLRLIAPVKPPLLIAFNKISSESFPQLVSALRSKFELEGMPCPPIFPLPYIAEGEWGSLSACEGGRQLRQRAAEAVIRDNLLIKPLLEFHWPQWTSPLRREHEAARQWESAVREALIEAGDHFERGYLRNPDYRETLELALVQLLELLEIPGLAAPMQRARHILTWPARQIVLWLRTVSDSSTTDASTETRVLEEGIDHLFLKLQRLAGERSISAAPEEGLWWQSLWGHLHDQQRLLLETGRGYIREHQAAFQPEIGAASLRLFQHLQQHPALLNSLRAARVTADVAAVILALKSGGIGLHDIFLTPAMLTFTSVLTEGAAGQFMSGIEKELKLAQATSVQAHLLQPFALLLDGLPQRMPGTGLFGITPEELELAETALRELPP